MAAAEATTMMAGAGGRGGPATTTSRFAARSASSSGRPRPRGCASVRRPLPLMPGADVEEPEAGPAAAGQQLSSAADDLPVARKASLQRFMEKRKGRAAVRAQPYGRPGERRDELTLAL